MFKSRLEEGRVEPSSIFVDGGEGCWRMATFVLRMVILTYLEINENSPSSWALEEEELVGGGLLLCLLKIMSSGTMVSS